VSGQLVELGHVDDHVDGGEEHHDLVAQHHGVVPAGFAASWADLCSARTLTLEAAIRRLERFSEMTAPLTLGSSQVLLHVRGALRNASNREHGRGAEHPCSNTDSHHGDRAMT
jgi:hypothetical protein